jgi:thymidylate synthase ThyX
MAYSAKILADSLAPSGKRLTTFELTYPRFVHAEFMTHRAISRNAASSRAIPVEKMLQKVEEDPAMPLFWGANQKGMQAHNEAEFWQKCLSESHWRAACRDAIRHAKVLVECNIHKQIVNRLLEPFSWITVIASGTEWSNFVGLRAPAGDSVDPTFPAQPEIQWVAIEVRRLLRENQPKYLNEGDWHLPLVDIEVDLEAAKRMSWNQDRTTAVDFHYYCMSLLRSVSAGRCARVSYLTHDGRRDLRADVELHNKLVNDGHWSPLEHVAQALSLPLQYGNFIGFKQYRKTFENECIKEDRRGLAA